MNCCCITTAIVLVAIIVIIIVVIVLTGIRKIDTNHVAIVYNKLTQNIDTSQIYKEGTKYLGPFRSVIQYPTTYSTMSLLGKNAVECRTSDGLKVSIEVSFQYRLNSTLENIMYIYTTFGEEYELTYLYLAQELIREVASNFTSFEYYNMSNIITENMKNKLNLRFLSYGADVNSFQLASFTVPQAFLDEHERTQSAIQQAETIIKTRENAIIQAESDVIKSAEDAKIIIVNGNASSIQITTEGNTQSSSIISEVSSEIQSYSGLIKELNLVYNGTVGGDEILAYSWIENMRKRNSTNGAIDLGYFDDE